MIEEPTPKTVDDLSAFLNQALETDPAAISTLFRRRVACNLAMADHPTIQVHADSTVGPLGLLNGLFGIREDGYGYLTAMWDDSISRILGFERTKRDAGGIPT
jgi:hypothetical protein